jgi:hypothetical protein
MDALETVILVTLCLPPARGEDALPPRNNGNWNHEESPVPTYRQNCHPAMSLCQLARRGIIHKELDLNQRALSGDQLEGKSQTIHIFWCVPRVTVQTVTLTSQHKRRLTAE